MIVEYLCKKCNYLFEKIIPRKDKNKPQICSQCGKKAQPIELSITASPQFKGSGWYKTDY